MLPTVSHFRKTNFSTTRSLLLDDCMHEKQRRRTHTLVCTRARSMYVCVYVQERQRHTSGEGKWAWGNENLPRSRKEKEKNKEAITGYSGELYVWGTLSSLLFLHQRREFKEARKKIRLPAKHGSSRKMRTKGATFVGEMCEYSLLGSF